MPKLPTSGLLPGAGIAGFASLLTGVTAVDALQLDFLHEAAENPGMDFDVELYPADPMPGEAVTFRLVNITGIPAGINPYLQTAVMVDFGDPGAVYESGGGQSDDANTAMGRVSAHVYASAGIYTATFTLHAVGVAPKTVAVPVSVTAKTPTVDLYLDFGEVSGAPDFGFAPAAGGGVQHITSAAHLHSLNLTDDNRIYRLTFKDDETFTDVISKKIDGDSIYIFTRSGHGTNKPRLTFSDVADVTKSVRVFRTETAANRLVVIGLDADGRYDPVTGIGPAGMISMFGSYGAVTKDRYISIWRCKGRGLLTFYDGGNGDLGVFTTHYRTIDNDHSDWLDYGIAWFGPHVAPCIVGNRLVQNPLAIQRDSYKYVLPSSSQHGPTRIQNTRWGCDENNLKVGASGWSPLPPGYYVQPCSRYMSAEADQQPDWEMYIHRNKGVGSCFVSIGSISNSKIIAKAPKSFVVTHNSMDTGRQALGGFAEMDCAGVHIGDNLHYRSNTYDFNQTANYFVRYRTFGGTYSDSTVFDGDISVMANTVFSDRTALSGGNSAFSLFDNFDTWPGDLMLVSENNLIHAHGHENGGGFPDLNAVVDRSADFKLVSSEALSYTTNNDVTVFDLALVPRGDETLLGAHHQSAAAIGPPMPPVNTAPPVIAALVTFPDEFGVISIGGWDNVDEDKLHLMEFDWKLNGVPVTALRDGGTAQAARYLVNAKVTGSGSDQLTCTVIMTNRSGIRVSAQSDPIMI